MTPFDQETFLHVFHTEACSDADAPVASILQRHFPTRRHLMSLGVARAYWVPSGFGAGSGTGRPFLPTRLALEVRTEGLYFYFRWCGTRLYPSTCDFIHCVTAFALGAI